ncbi:MAG: asparagine synthase (glutamine-hydrolyzing) [Piscinibacter sp.]|nr:asparagine synthase (glutamine-hydrolyzing) [Piscinibacter sp.]
MCGFAGFVRPAGFEPESARALGLRMGESIRQRGPDDFGVWCDELAGVVLSHRRLSIVDTSAAGHQPMVSVSGRYVIAYNGEIYNHLALRKALPGRDLPWRGHSDTETLLAGFEGWGIEQTIRRSVGMFAFAVWDRERRSLVLGRDRLGEKPLYFGVQDDGGSPVLLFGSQLNALAAHPAFAATVDREALCLLLRHGYVPSPRSIYRGLHKLPPGHLLEWPIGEKPDALSEPPSSRAYWSIRETVTQGLASRFAGSDDQALAELDALLRDAVAQQMVADVPLGAFLSGGIDSSAIVALMQAQSTQPVKTFTIGFAEEGYDEAVHAKRVARHLGTDHTELYVSAEQALAIIPRLPDIYDEPFADSSQIPTFLVSQLARQHVTVALSGDAGDELFGGYSRYAQAARIWGTLGRMPRSFRVAAGAALRALPVAGWDLLGAPLRRALPVHMRNVGDKAHKLAELFRRRDRLSFYQGLVSDWPAPDRVVSGAHEPPYLTTLAAPGSPAVGFIESMMMVDAMSYLPEDILAKVDRAAMGVSLETRVPLLDHRVVEFAWRLPLHMKCRQGAGKWILKRLLDGYVPRALVERPKSGFGVPLAAWLRGPLRDWAESLLDETRLRREGYFNPAPVRRKWQEHLAGRRNWQNPLWNVLMFQAWLEQGRGHRG